MYADNNKAKTAEINLNLTFIQIAATFAATLVYAIALTSSQDFCKFSEIVMRLLRLIFVGQVSPTICQLPPEYLSTRPTS
ncbi:MULTISPECIES: hypothetical protein [unclassified Microcoleus]|uniref:hypothetical protein n=1 Tax=unclassified Microcoleus TaxID=2642155 RepID=UPI002FD6629B